MVQMPNGQWVMTECQRTDGLPCGSPIGNLPRMPSYITMPKSGQAAEAGSANGSPRVPQPYPGQSYDDFRRADIMCRDLAEQQASGHQQYFMQCMDYEGRRAEQAAREVDEQRHAAEAQAERERAAKEAAATASDQKLREAKAAAERERAAAEWAALPDEEKERRLAEAAAAKRRQEEATARAAAQERQQIEQAAAPTYTPSTGSGASRSSCISDCEFADSQCRSNNAAGMTAGLLGGGLNATGGMIGGFLSNDCGQKKSSCVSSCNRNIAN